jgi:2-polyprenyl-6-methoxyphenol hydroxylase-like FAD-dependent oxidoreductase
MSSGWGVTFRRTGAPENLGGLREQNGRWLMRADQVPASRYEPPILIHRADLIEILLRALPRHALQTGARVRRVRDESCGVVVEHSAGHARADIAIGADGIHSAVRRAVPAREEASIRRQHCWRFITEQIDASVELTESWGSGEAFGGGQLRDGQVYCYACAWVPEGQHCNDEFAEVRRRFSGWHAPIPQLLSLVDPTRVLRNDICDLPPLQAFSRGHVALAGDAAHAMTPALGQGGCQGLEDAVDLACALASPHDIVTALHHYDARRRPRAQRIARQSRWAGQVTRFSAPTTVWLRRRLVSALPPAAVLRVLERPFEWTAPRLNETGVLVPRTERERKTDVQQANG